MKSNSHWQPYRIKLQLDGFFGDLAAWTLSTFGFSATCPYCRSPDLRRSARRNIFETALGVVFLPYRCRRCYRRSFRLRFGKSPSPPQP